MLREFIANIMFIALQWSFSDLVPFYQYLPTDIARRFRQTVKTRDTYYRTKFDEHRATYEKGTVRDIVDALLTAYDHERADYKGRDVGTSDDIIFHMMGLTIANSDNTTSSLTWFVLYMALYQEEQKKVHEELIELWARTAPSAGTITKSCPTCRRPFARCSVTRSPCRSWGALPRATRKSKVTRFRRTSPSFSTRGLSATTRGSGTNRNRFDPSAFLAATVTSLVGTRRRSSSRSERAGARVSGRRWPR